MAAKRNYVQMDKCSLSLVLEANMSLLFAYIISYLYKRPSYSHTYIRQVVIESEIKDHWHLGNLKSMARNSTWRLLWKDGKQGMRVALLWAAAGRKRTLLIASETTQVLFSLSPTKF